MRKNIMFAAVCLAAFVLAASGCQENSGHSETFSSTVPAFSMWDTEKSAETLNTTTSVSEAKPAADTAGFTTTVINGEEFVIYTTSETSAPASETQISSAVTTAADTTTTPEKTSSEPVTTSETTFSEEAMAPEDGTIVLELLSGTDNITTDTDSVSLKISYVGNDENTYITGVDYTLERMDDGEWKEIAFREGHIFIEPAYEVSQASSPKIQISLSDEDYSEPLTEGEYRIAKKISGKYFYAEFTISAADEPAEYELCEGKGSITLQIHEIKDDGFNCMLPWAYPAYYYVVCDTAKYSDYCIGDIIDVNYSEKYRSDEWDFRLIMTEISVSDFELDPDVEYKPVIYLYPDETTDVSVRLDFNGKITVTEPKYNNGWNVTAYPNGTLECDGRQYPYLFWEGIRNYEVDTSKGFCVSGEDTEAFLRDKLNYLGLNKKETEEFLGFWLPYMKDNSYNVITFAAEDYTDNAKLDIDPAPETVIRVFMKFSPSDSYVAKEPQHLEKAPGRKGFTVIEWGGSIYR